MSDLAVTPTPAVTPPANTETPADDKTAKTNHLLETPADSPDPDEVELNEAIAAAKAEEEAAPAAEAAGATPAVETPAAVAAPAAAMVPVAAVQDERAKRQEAEELLRKSMGRETYWKGVADGRFPVPTVGGTQQPQAQQPNARTEIRGKMKALADEVDAGKLSVAEYEEQRSALDDQINEIRDREILEKVQGNDLSLKAKTGSLEQTNPWLAKVPEAELLDLVPGAERDLAAAGVDYAAIAGTPLGTLTLREAVVARAKKRGLDVEYGAAHAASGTPAPGALPAARPTQAQIDDKKALAAAAPPAPQGGAAPSQTWTEDRIASIDTVDFENLPLSELKKIGDALDRSVSGTRVTAHGR